MMLSTRKDPPLFLTIPQTSNKNGKLKQYLFNSPLPSPSLPSILPRHGKKPPRLNTRRALRFLCWLSIVTSIFWLLQRISQIDSGRDRLTDQTIALQNGGAAVSSDLAKGALPVIVKDKKGRSRWTITIPSSLRFPLSATNYEKICTQAREVSIQVAAERHNLRKVQDLEYQDIDNNYIDIAEAQESGLIPMTNYLHQSPTGQSVCDKSLTYILDATEAGLGDTLLGLWLSYGLAKREGRAFFIDYSGFAYGKYTSLFAHLPPVPGCRPPPWGHRTPYPHFAKHLIVGASTHQWTFGRSFLKEYDIKEVFSMAREGYEALFKLKHDDQQYVENRWQEQKAAVGETGLLVGVHIRRGDRHPFEFQYQQGYLPPNKYMSVVHGLIRNHPNSSVLLASDDADIYHHPELEGTVRAQDKIRLASKRHTNHGGLGWEGGFFKDAFWDIGLPEHASNQKILGSPEPSLKKPDRPQARAADQERNYRSQPTAQALQLRQYLARAYLLDLAMLAKSDEVVCGVSSKACRVLAVMMGWEKLHQGHWRNVDGDYGWRALFE